MTIACVTDDRGRKESALIISLCFPTFDTGYNNLDLFRLRDFIRKTIETGEYGEENISMTL